MLSPQTVREIVLKCSAKRRLNQPILVLNIIPAIEGGSWLVRTAQHRLVALMTFLTGGSCQPACVDSLVPVAHGGDALGFRRLRWLPCFG